jgi:hypothetical protein
MSSATVVIRHCPMCRIRSTHEHKGDRHVTTCLHYGDNSWPGLLVVSSPLPPGYDAQGRPMRVTEPGHSAKPAPIPAQTAVVTEKPAQTRRCIVCGKDLVMPKRGPRPRFCSVECRRQGWKR